MTLAEYKRMTSVQLRGRKARTLADMRNGVTVVPENTVVTIHGKSGKTRLSGGPGLAIEMPACESCGVSVYMTKVAIRDLELLPQE